MLAEELRHRWPQIAVNVINKGVGGQLSYQMLARFERDVLPYHPQLVIWQTGSNQVLKSENIEGYAETLHEGISRLKAAKADVILMDPQFAPRVLARRTHLQIVDSIAAVANDTNVAVFQRLCCNAALDSEQPIQDGGHHFERRPAHDQRELWLYRPPACR